MSKALRSPRIGSVPVLLPTSRRERARGLRGRRPVPMLFARARSVHTFGMREAIVVAFLTRDRRVLRVSTVPPRRIVWCARSRHVLEAPAGTDLRVGDRFATATGPAASR